MNKRKISVVIPFYNSEETLNLCLTPLCNQTVKPDEIVLVDNNSKDNSKKIIESFINTFHNQRIIYTTCERQGPSAARNKGVDIASGEWIVFTDSDCVPSSDWLSDYITHFDDERIGAVAGCIKPYPPINSVQKALSLFTLPENEKDDIHDDFTLNKGLYPTANMAVRKEIFISIGRFNEPLKYGEDRELCARIYRAGYKIKSVKNAVIEHIHRKNIHAFLTQSFGFGTAHPYELRHLTSGRFIFMSPFLKCNRVAKGTYVWLDFNQADKKLFVLILVAFIWWPLCILGFGYFFYLCSFVNKKAKQKDIKTGLFELPFLALLLILKSLCLTAGRISYSLKNRVICI